MKNEFMKKMALACVAGLALFSVQAQQLPVYLDGNQPIESRVEDALSPNYFQDQRSHSWYPRSAK